MLDREEYVEQAYFFRTLHQRLAEGLSTQDLLVALRQELLATTKLPMALDFMACELKHSGGLAPAMAHLGHYFTPFQAFVVREAEKPEGRFDFRVAMEVLEKEAEYRSKEAGPQGIFLYQFEVLCRNRLGYDRGLEAMAGDWIYNDAWRDWILTVRRQVGFIDIADMIYVRSQYYRITRGEPEDKPALFGEKEGRIALANRQKDPIYLFSALARHLGYPTVPRARPQESEQHKMVLLQRYIERLEARLRLLEEEVRGGINLNRFMAQSQKPEPKP